MDTARVIGGILSALLLNGCGVGEGQPRLATTTSVEDSGLLADILPAFRRAEPKTRISLLAVGSGEALRLATSGDADGVIAHSPAATRGRAS